MTDTPNTHTYLLLDRSGSMSSIADDVVGGFNTYLAGVVADEPNSPVTLVQFDGHDPHEVVIDAVPAREATPLTAREFQPRGNTPLLDATGLMIRRAARRADRLAAAGSPPEDIVIVTVTDGHENASNEFTRISLTELIKAREAAGWTFVYLSADLDAYADAEALGYSNSNVQRWAPSAEGSSAAFAEVGRGRVVRREMLHQSANLRRQGRDSEADELERLGKADYFAGTKDAESRLRSDRKRGPQ